MKTTTIGWFGALALGLTVGPLPAAFAQVPGATIGLPADLGDLGTRRSTDGPTSAGGDTAPGAGRTKPGGNPGGLSRSAGTGVQGTSNGAGAGRPRTGRATGGAGGSGAGIAASPNRDDDYLNPLYGRGSR